MRVITLRLTATELAAVDELIGRGHYLSRTDLLRQGMMDILRASKLSAEARQTIQLERQVHGLRRRKRRDPKEA